MKGNDSKNPTVGRVTPPGAPRRPHRLRRLDGVWIGDGFPKYFLTICIQGRRAVLANGGIHDRLVAFLLGSPDRYEWWPGRYVLMPDHLHLLAMQAPEAVPLGEWIKALKAFVANREFRWQESVFDHLLRSDESESEKWEYILQNPLRAGLVTNAEDWLYAGEFDWNDERPHRVR